MQTEKKLSVARCLDRLQEALTESTWSEQYQQEIAERMAEILDKRRGNCPTNKFGENFPYMPGKL